MRWDPVQYGRFAAERGRPFLDLLSSEDIAEEITRTLASAIGLVLAVPITTAIAVACVAGPGVPMPARRSRGAHAG